MYLRTCPREMENRDKEKTNMQTVPSLDRVILAAGSRGEAAQVNKEPSSWSHSMPLFLLITLDAIPVPYTPHAVLQRRIWQGPC